MILPPFMVTVYQSGSVTGLDAAGADLPLDANYIYTRYKFYDPTGNSRSHH